MSSQKQSSNTSTKEVTAYTRSKWDEYKWRRDLTATFGAEYHSQEWWDEEEQNETIRTDTKNKNT